jgi:hypothetical protein
MRSLERFFVLKAGELFFYLLADPRHGRSRERRLVAEHLAKRGLDVAVGQPPHPGRDNEGLEGVRARDAEAEQLRTKLLVGVAQLRPAELDRSHRRLHGDGRLPAVARSGRGVFVSSFIGPPAQERVDLGLDRLLHEEADSETTDLLEHGREVLVRRDFGGSTLKALFTRSR